MKASIICVGTELVTGKTIETNSYFLAEELRQYGIYTHQKLIVEDQLEQMVPLMDFALKTSDFILVTGGLGPTLDDLTREAVSQLTGLALEMNEDIKDRIIKLVSTHLKGCPVNNYKQALIPKDSKILQNDWGTAPGFITAYNNKQIIVLPGPPREMKPMFLQHVVPIIKELSSLVFLKKNIEIFGIGESALEESLGELMTSQTNPTLATYASFGSVSLVITAEGTSEEECIRILTPVVQQVKEKVGEYIISEDGEKLENIVQKLLSNNEMTLSVAESCTGGQLSARLTALSGISSVFERGYITYSNQSKIQALGVLEETIQLYGAVSEETAMAMIKGLKEESNCHCCLSITGIAGPNGGTDSKPVGLVYIGVNVLDDYKVYQFNFNGNRDRIQNLAVLSALNLLRKSLLIIK